MARSRFRLEPLLKIRQMQEDQAKRVVAEQLRRIEQVQQQIAALQDRTAEALGVMRSLVLAGSIVPLEATRQRGYIGRLQVQRVEMEGHLRALYRQLALDRAALAEASKRRKILDKLKERQHQRRLLAENRAEQRASDEMGVLRFAHSSGDADGMDAGNVLQDARTMVDR